MSLMVNDGTHRNIPPWTNWTVGTHVKINVPNNSLSGTIPTFFKTLGSGSQVSLTNNHLLLN